MQSVYKDWNFGDTWEQPFWNQVVGSVTNGKPYHQLGNDRSPEEWRQENGGYSLHSRRQHLNISWPPEWRNRTGIEFGPLQTVHNLTLPVVDDAWWQRYSKYFYPPEEGELSDRFFKLVRDSVDQPLFQLGKPWTALGLPEENFAFFPCWFTCAYAFRGWPGYWDLKPPAAVVLHDVYIPAHSGDWKMYTFKGINLFQWEATEAVRGHNVLGLPDPKLLMLAPGVQLYSQTEQTFLEDVKQLVRLADMMGRQLVVPNPPCDSMWVGVWRNQEQTWLPVWEYNYEGIQVLQFYDRLRPGNHTYCHWIRSVERRCTEVAPAYADTVAFLERWPNREQATPTERNTLWHAEWQAAGGAAGPPPSPPAVIVTPRPEIAVANAEAVVEAAAAFADWTVLFLGAVPKLGSASTLRPLSDQHKQCWLFADPPPQLDPLGSAGESRQRWLNGTL